MQENKNRYKIGDRDSMQTILEITKRNCEGTADSIYLFNVLKYLIRYPLKNKIDDLRKAQDYLQRLIDYYVEEESKENSTDEITFNLTTKIRIKKDTFKLFYTNREQAVEEFSNAINKALKANDVKIDFEEF